MTRRTGAGARGARAAVEAAPIRLPTDVGRSVGAMPERTRTVSERAKAMLVTTVAALVLATPLATVGGVLFATGTTTTRLRLHQDDLERAGRD